MKLIYHLASAEMWAKSMKLGAYTHPSLESEGFIHCSTAEQILWVANRFYHGRRDLILLAIDEGKLESLIKYEMAEGVSGKFPHLFGALPLSAVCYHLPFQPNNEGTFTELPKHS